ncbi:NmrA family NAD(P)-binding protein [Pseudomonas sp. NPDC088368]|uniref:NmrA family NAD(P)-binding protein n=1 Tax=Pseudomonas sp. NPDC088368 TaxID=3364453 RepID=UPI0037F475D9
MSQQLILVTGPTGSTGRFTIDNLLLAGAKVRALVHSDDERAAALRARGVEVMIGDLLDPESLRPALAGVVSAYFVWPVRAQLMEATAYFAYTAYEAGLKAIVNMSQISARRDAESDAARQHWFAEKIFDRCEVPVTHLRPTFFMEWLKYPFQLPLIREQNILSVPAGEGRHAPIAAADQGRVISSILLNPEPHAGKTYKLFGAVEMSHTEVAAVLSQVLGRTITYVDEPLDAFEARLHSVGSIQEHRIQHFMGVYVDYKNGIFAGTNDVVERLTGRTPMTVQEYVETNRKDFDNKGYD